MLTTSKEMLSTQRQMAMQYLPSTPRAETMTLSGLSARQPRIWDPDYAGSLCEHRRIFRT